MTGLPDDGWTVVESDSGPRPGTVAVVETVDGTPVTAVAFGRDPVGVVADAGVSLSTIESETTLVSVPARRTDLLDLERHPHGADGGRLPSGTCVADLVDCVATARQTVERRLRSTGDWFQHPDGPVDRRRSVVGGPTPDPGRATALDGATPVDALDHGATRSFDSATGSARATVVDAGRSALAVHVDPPDHDPFLWLTGATDLNDAVRQCAEWGLPLGELSCDGRPVAASVDDASAPAEVRVTDVGVDVHGVAGTATLDVTVPVGARSADERRGGSVPDV